MFRISLSLRPQHKGQQLGAGDGDGDGDGDGTASAWSGSLDNNNGSLGLPGVIDLSTAANFQPDGTLLAAATSDFTTFALNTGYDPERVLFRCAAADVDQLF